MIIFQESSISILRGVGDEEDDEDLEVGDILNDEEIDTILEDSDDDTDRYVSLNLQSFGAFFSRMYELYLCSLNTILHK